MDQLIIESGTKLEGKIRVNGSKNAILPILAGSLLTEEEVIIENVPSLKDVQIMGELVLNIKSKIHENNYIKPNHLNEIELPETMGYNISSSLLLIGAMLNYFSKVKIPLPRGCSIGMRNIDFHVEGLTALGAIIHMKNGYIIAEKKGRLIGTDINFRFSSVGATHHIIIAACLAEGMTVIRNAAKEPEVIDLADFLNSMGADIKGAGTSVSIPN